MSPLKAEWVADDKQRKLIGTRFTRGGCRDLVVKMVKGGEKFTRDDMCAYEWLMENMSSFLKGTVFEKLIPGFKMALTNAWEGGEKVFFDLELLCRLEVALSIYLSTANLERGIVYGALSSPFSVDKRRKDP